MTTDSEMDKLHTATLGLPYGSSADVKYLRATRDWIPNVLARLGAVRDLHRPFPVMGTGGQMLTGQPPQMCITCRAKYPCPTIQALNGEQK